MGYGESGSCSVVSNSLQTHGLYSPWNSPGQNTGVGSLFRLQEFFPTQRLNPGLPNCRWILYQLSHKGSPWGYSGCHDYPRVGTSSFSLSRGRACCCTLGVANLWWVQAAGLWGGGVDTPSPHFQLELIAWIQRLEDGDAGSYAGRPCMSPGVISKYEVLGASEGLYLPSEGPHP